MARENSYRGGRLIRYFYSELDNRDLHSRDGREEVIMGACSGWLLRNGAVERWGAHPSSRISWQDVPLELLSSCIEHRCRP